MPLALVRGLPLPRGFEAETAIVLAREDMNVPDTVGNGFDHSSFESSVAEVDLRMPGMGGEVLLDTLRDRDPNTARRVMFMTGHIARDDEALLAAYADVPLIEKPFSLNELGRRLDELAARLRAGGP